MVVFYKGEDINVTLALFADDSMKVPIAIVGYDIDMVLYANGQKHIIHASTTPSVKDADITIVNENTITVTLSKNVIEKLTCGVITMEARFTSNKNDSQSRIVKSYVFSLEDTRIKNI